MAEPEGIPEKESPRPGIVAAFAGAACFVLMLAVLCVYRFVGGFTKISDETAKWNDFGVFFGGVLGPLLSALTLAAVVYTLVLQMRQLAVSDKEKALLQGQLDAAAKVQRDMADGLKKQLETSAEQAAATTFFEMVRLQHELTSGLRHGALTGRSAFTSIYLTFQNYYNSFATTHPNADKRLNLAKWDELVFDLYVHESAFEFAHYFSNLWQIFKYIQESPLPDKQRFADVVRSQMTAYEQAMLFYYAASSYGSEIRPLLAAFGTFKYMSPNLLFNVESTRDLPAGVWGGKFLTSDPD